MLAKTHLFREIHEQPTVTYGLLASQREVVSDLARAIIEQEITHVVIAARGTSDNAARYAQYVLGAMNGLTVALATPSLFSVYQRPPRFGSALVLGISQSGKSPDIVAVLAEAKRQNKLTAVITNMPESDLAQMGDFVVDLSAGIERAIAATKTYTTELAAVALLSAILAADNHLLAELDGVPEAMAETLVMNDVIAQAAPRYRYMTNCVVIGRGFNYSTAFELALKLEELTYVTTQSFSSADFLHGPMALIEPGYPVIVVAPSGVMLPELRAFVTKLRERQAETIIIADDPTILDMARIPLALPRLVPEWLSPMTAIIPGQLFSMHLAHARDYDVDSPRGLLKVTETK